MHGTARSPEPTQVIPAPAEATPSWDDLRFFLAAAREGGFGAAARRLGTEQSTVSRRIASFERALGARVFDRAGGGRALSLTQLGHRLVVEAEVVEAALRRVQDLSSQAERAPVGLVRIATTETMASAFLLPRIIPALLDRYPGLRVDLVVGDLPADLGRREADLAVRFFLDRTGDLVTKRVAVLETALLAEKQLAHALRSMPPERWPWISAWLRDGIPPEETLRLALAPVPARITMNSFQAQWAAVRAGLGVAVLPRILLDDGLVALPLPAEAAALSLPRIPVYLATPRASRRIPRVAVVYEALAEGLGTLSSAARSD